MQDPWEPPRGDMEGQLDPEPGTQGWPELETRLWMWSGGHRGGENSTVVQWITLESSMGEARGGDRGGAVEMGGMGGKPAVQGPWDRGSDFAQGGKEDGVGHR